MTPTIQYWTSDKSAWGDGPWLSEPDKQQWQDATTGLPCLIVRNTRITGALCGYVGVGRDHPAHGMSHDHWCANYTDDDSPGLSSIQKAINAVEVHGGLTFASGCSHGDDPSEGICHIPGNGEPDDVWWFGFDCAHAGDVSPAIDATLREIGSPRREIVGWEQHYRDMAYVEAEVASLAAQLKAMESVK